MSQRTKVYIIGVGMTKFEKPGKRTDFDYPVMVKEAVTKALEDAKVSYDNVKAACVGYVYGDSACGQRALYQMGFTGCPIYNVNNNCATGSTALMMAKQFIESGSSDCVLALGFEKMETGSVMPKYMDRTNPLDKHVELMVHIAGINESPVTAQLFGNAGLEHMRKYGTKVEHFAKIACKNHLHSTNNPYSQFQERYTLDEVMKSPKVFGPLTKLQCCPTSDGAAAVVLANEDFVRKRRLESQAVEIVAMEMVSDLASTFTERSSIKLVGYDMTKRAAEKVFTQSSYKPSDVDVIELHDCFSTNELITYEALGLCPPGDGGKLVDTGDNTYRGKYVINPSGGLISKGHPLGATGLAQCAELCWQLRGEAGKRQVPNAKLALQHNIGLGGVVVVALYRMGFNQPDITKSNLSASDSDQFKASALFKLLDIAMQEDEENLVEKVRGVFGFKVINGPGGAEGFWVVDSKVGKGKVEYNGKTKPDVIITISDMDIVDFISGKLNPQKAFFQGKIKIQGNMGMAMKLIELQKRAGKKIELLRSKL
ncbi:sterol carrier protein X-related thiolase [Bombus vancouverensis nearcticus]|uniref:Sterol carrier protein 2 n=1 Tax=Bombus bifarius TaxID=103933 RepID=A0A6P8MT90_9HYME|nr:non-specific lipid-transfer protein [Bombus vancouverensis nearcticus]XP_033183057.1 non-specific lipid-transfer protein [Bombus vancouverensis nearcticus]XP_033311627.1 non-specific lipid-transfer protein [Bombus bifarius]XP_033311628.1 non-specific lipid-transfer protein [Bombus bifarius]